MPVQYEMSLSIKYLLVFSNVFAGWVYLFLDQSLRFLFFPSQSISAPGSGIWSDGKDKNDGSQAHTWNVEVLIDVVKEVVREQSVSFH